MVSNSQQGLQRLMNNVNKVTKKFGMKINVKKTKVTCISRRKETKIKILIDGQRVQEVDELKYLGSVVTSDGYCEQDVCSRVAMGKKAFMDKRKLISSSLNIDLRKELSNVLSGVWHSMRQRLGL